MLSVESATGRAFSNLQNMLRPESGFEGKISKSELCTGTAAELLYSLCLRRQSMVGTVFKKAQSSKVWSKLERQRN